MLRRALTLACAVEGVPLDYRSRGALSGPRLTAAVAVHRSVVRGTRYSVLLHRLPAYRNTASALAYRGSPTNGSSSGSKKHSGNIPSRSAIPRSRNW